MGTGHLMGCGRGGFGYGRGSGGCGMVVVAMAAASAARWADSAVAAASDRITAITMVGD